MDGVDYAGEGLDGGEFVLQVGDERGADGVDALHDGAGEGYGRWREAWGVGGHHAAQNQPGEVAEILALVGEDAGGGLVAGQCAFEDEGDEL